MYEQATSCHVWNDARTASKAVLSVTSGVPAESMTKGMTTWFQKSGRARPSGHGGWLLCVVVRTYAPAAPAKASVAARASAEVTKRGVIEPSFRAALASARAGP